MEENILCAICGENISYYDGTLWFTRADGSEVLICEDCCDMLDAAESGRADEFARANAYFRSKIDIYMPEDISEMLEKTLEMNSAE